MKKRNIVFILSLISAITFNINRVNADIPDTLNYYKVYKTFKIENSTKVKEETMNVEEGSQVNILYSNKEYSINSLNIKKYNIYAPQCRTDRLVEMRIIGSGEYYITYKCPKCGQVVNVPKYEDITSSIQVSHVNGQASFTMPNHDIYVDIYLKKEYLYNGISSMKAQLYGYNDVYIYWGPSLNSYKIDGYYIYYKKTTSKNYTYIGRIQNKYYKQADLDDGVNYQFKVVPYYIDSMTGETVKGEPAYRDIYTLKKIVKPTVKKKNKNYVKVSWSKINNTSGYEISQSTKTKKTNVVKRLGSNYNNYKIKAKRYKKYYYKIRAYKVVDGKRIYGPWGKAKSYTLK